ncbi:putative polysaccharide biosynthesis protein [Gorillibacterium sp. sgz5001074]|uniref:putative polysaccharide biosynthesis protein n=1 Tax=Gorillibacterium sp. sgz5001074 TaxID=3446695 RepID=UPI003F6783BC
MARMNRMKGGGLFRGAAVLGLAAVVSKLLGTLQKIPLQNIAGDEVFGIYNAVYPLYTLILTLATAGFPIAVSKFVADAVVSDKPREVERVFGTALWMLSLTGVLGFAGLYAGSDAIAGAFGMRAAAPAIRSVSFALLAAPAMAAVRGFFQGLQDMVPTAVSQVAEQTVRVAVMVTLLLVLMDRGAAPSAIAAGATFGSTAGVAGGMAAVLWFWLRWRKRGSPLAEAGAGGGPAPGERGPDEVPARAGRRLTGDAPEERTMGLVRRFAVFAIPVCLGSIALPVLTLVDALTMPRLLAGGGRMTEAAAAHLFGIYNHGMPLVQLVTMIATSMAAALVPSVAAAAAAQDGRLLQARTEPVLRFTWLVGLAAAFGLAATSLPVNVMLFESPQGWQAMAVVAFTALFATLHVVTGSMLQGLGAVMVPARSLFIAAGLKLAGNLLLVPLWGLQGAAAAAVAAYAAAAALNLRALQGLVPQAVTPPRALLAPLAAAAGMGVAVLAVEGALLEGLHRFTPLPERLRYTAAALAAVAAGAAFYAAALFRTGAVRPADLLWIPGFDTKWKPVLYRLRLLPKSRD